MFVDTHCHLYKEYYDDIEKIIQNSKNNGINICINAGCDKSTNQEVLSIKNDSIYAVIGYHPEFANDITEEDFSLLEKELNNSNVIGIGEIGLDYHYDGFNKEKQITVFEKQLSLAEKYNLPLIMFLGSGINYIYPSIAEDVYNYCKSGKGVIISEYPDVTKPLAHHFPFRNRLIACSSKKIILPEANLKSGSYSTINQALNYGKEIGTFPFPLSYEKSLNNHLIQDGAEILLNVSDLLSFLKDN